jgi:hypothetical protein
MLGQDRAFVVETDDMERVLASGRITWPDNLVRSATTHG